MTVNVEVIGNGSYAGAKTSVENYSITEEATPIAASDTSGAVGTLLMNAMDNPERFGTALMLYSTLRLTDDVRGAFVGDVTSLAGADGGVGITANSRLGKLVTTTNAAAVNTTFGGAVAYYMGLGGITTGITVDSSLSGLPVVAQGWIQQDLWTKIKELCVVYGAEIAVVDSEIIVRPFRGRDVKIDTASSVSWNYSVTDTPHQIEVMYYNTEYRSNSTMVPNPDMGIEDRQQIITVDVDETVVTNIPVPMWLNSIETPTMVDFNGWKNAVFGASSIYAVSSTVDDFDIMPAQWAATGGKLSVAIGEDGRSIDVTVKGPKGSLDAYAPFQIALSSGSGNNYATLRIRGTGVYYRENSITSWTGAGGDAARGIGLTIANPFVRSLSDAWKVAYNVAQDVSAPDRTVTVNAFKTPLTGDVSTLGNLPGSRFAWRRNIFRVKSSTVTESRVDLTAEVDTTFDDFNKSAAGMTFSQFNTSFNGIKFGEFALAPLPVVEPEYDRY